MAAPAMGLDKLRSAAVPTLLWFWLFHHLHAEWMLNVRYNYGWAVPFLAAFLFFARWQTAPAAEAPPIRSARRAAVAGWLVLAVLLPIRLVEEANPDWRLLSWTLALCVVSYTLSAIFRAGGWRWTLHFVFPVCFPLVAVPWPVQIENTVVQAMARAVASSAVEIVSWLGIGAYQLGNIIQLANGFVGVDEACSGVKTLQTGIMVALFLGELLALTVARRSKLLLFGCAWVFACNILRASALVMIAARRGIPALEQWHDFVGGVVIILGLGGLVAAALALSERRAGPPPPAAHPAPLGLRLGEIAAALVWLALIFSTSEIWYRRQETKLLARPRWEVRWPTEDAKPLPIAETTSAILRYNEASSAAWVTPPGIQWWGFFARWAPERAALQLARSHSPEICLPAVGRTFRGEVEPLRVEAGGIVLQFRALEFEQEGRPVFVFVCIQEDRTTFRERADSMDWNARGRLLAAWRGERNLGQRLLELAVIGFPDVARAREATAEIVRAILLPPAPTG